MNIKHDESNHIQKTCAPHFQIYYYKLDIKDIEHIFF